MSVMIQVLLAAVMTASGLMLSATAQAASTVDLPSLMPVVVAEIDLGMPKLAPETASPFAEKQVIPDHLFALDTVTPAGSFAWAGIDEFAQLDAAPMAERQDLKRKIAQDDRDNEIDIELLTAAPAPEPPTSVLAGIALVAGGIWTRARRR